MKCDTCKNVGWYTEYEPPVRIAVCSKGHWSDDPYIDGPDDKVWDYCKDYEHEYIEAQKEKR